MTPDIVDVSVVGAGFRSGEPDPASAASAASPALADAGVTKLFEHHHMGLLRLALLLVGDKPTAEDVVQDAFVRLHAKWRQLRAEANALAYVRASVVNGCRSVHRRRALAHRIGSVHEPPVWSAESEVLLGEDRREVMRAVQALPARQREALILRYYADLTDIEIAETMGISHGTARSTISRALTSVARILGEDR